MTAVETETRLESLICDQVVPQLALMDERMSGMEKRVGGRLTAVDSRVVALAKAVTLLHAEVRERPRTATVVGIVISTVIGVVGLVIGTIALAPYLRP